MQMFKQMDTMTFFYRRMHFYVPVIFRPQPKRLGAYRFGVSVRLSVCLSACPSVCPSYFFVRARTFERKVIETWL